MLRAPGAANAAARGPRRMKGSSRLDFLVFAMMAPRVIPGGAFRLLPTPHEKINDELTAPKRRCAALGRILRGWSGRGAEATPRPNRSRNAKARGCRVPVA